MKNSYKYKMLYFAIYSGLASYYALFSIYLSESMNYSKNYIGFILAIPPIISIIFQPIWGAISDIINSKRVLLIAISILLTLMISLLGFVENKYLFLLIFSIYSIALSGVIPLSDSMSVNYANQNKLIKLNFGDIRLCGSLGYAIMVLLVSILVEKTNIRIMFVFSGISFFLTFLILLGVKEYKNYKISQNYFKDIKKLFSLKKYTIIIIFVFILLGTIFGSEQYLNLYMRKSGITISQIGIITLFSVLMEVPAMYSIKKIVNKINPINAMFVIIITTLLRFFTLPFIDTFLGFVLVQMLRGIIVGIAFVMFLDYIIEIVSSEISTSAIALFYAISIGLSQSIFIILAGIISENSGYENLFFIYGLFNLLGFIIVIRMRLSKQNN